ncbi:MAG: MCE family protein [Mycobacterium sp.]
MTITTRRKAGDPLWWTAGLVVTLAAIIWLTTALYSNSFRSYVRVNLASPRSGLVMEPGSKVKLRGVEVGRVATVTGVSGTAELRLDIYRDELKFIPANIEAQIRATTAFGAKYVDLMYPKSPTQQRLAAGAILHSRNVSTEVNTVFQNLVGVLNQIDPAKLNAVLSAFAEGVRGQGPAIGQAITDTNEVLLAVNARSQATQADWQALTGFSDAYSGAAHDILNVIDAASTTSTTITTQQGALNQLLLSAIGFSQQGTDLLGPNQGNLIHAFNGLEPTTDLLLKYNPEYTCLLVGSKWFVDKAGYAVTGGNGYSSILDSEFLLGDDPYQYPDNLPVVAAKGGPGGKPGCGSLPNVDDDFPVRYLVTDTGWGTGLDVRPNPGIGHPCWVDYLPVTRAVPEPPSIRQCIPGPAPGPVVAPGAPPYGAAEYGPDGAPLFPGVPPPPPVPPAPAPPP